MSSYSYHSRFGDSGPSSASTGNSDDGISVAPPLSVGSFTPMTVLSLHTTPDSGISSPNLQRNWPEEKYFHSRRLKKADIPRPAALRNDPMEKWVTIIPLIGAFIGFCIAGFLIWDGTRTVINHNYCPVFIDDFASGHLDSNVWTKEVQCGGYGNGQFEMTTNSDENSYIEDKMLHIKPTLQDKLLVETENTIDLREKGLCSGTKWVDCVAQTSFKNGTIVNPVKSARLHTKKGASIRYGRVEVTAKLPRGDWLWPAIWMLPVKDVYGPWPLSGEIDIIEARGNSHLYEQGGNNIVSSALHWGPDAANDAWWKTNVKRRSNKGSFSDSFHTYGLEWSDTYIFTYIDSRLLQVMYTPFERPFWQRGDFPQANANGTRFSDPWSFTGRDAAPFDQSFYLVINVAVGAQNGWFANGKSGKPWVDHSRSAPKDFWEARDKWYSTWKDGGAMVVKSVKMWQQCD